MTREHSGPLDFRAIRSVWFDFDDALVLTRGPHNEGPAVACHKTVASEVYGHTLTDEVVDRYWGKGLKVELPNFYGMPEASFEEMLGHFIAASERFPKPLLPGARDLLDALRKAEVPVGILTSLLGGVAVEQMRMAGLDPADFVAVQGPDVTELIKPDKRAFDKALGLLAVKGISPHEVLYVGDAMSDATASTGAGLQFVGVATGRVSEDAFYEAGYDAVAGLQGVQTLLAPILRAASL